MSNKPILFYSPNCRHCINLWKKLKQNNILDSIIKINVTNNRNIPNSIKSVPTLVVKGRPPITGQGIEFFFNSYVPNKSEQPNKNNNVQPNIPSQGGISDFLPGEMGSSWSDQYSFIDNSNPINHSYSFLNSNNSGIPSANEISNIKQNNSGSKRNSDIDSKLEAFKNARSQDFSNRR